MLGLIEACLDRSDDGMGAVLMKTDSPQLCEHYSCSGGCVIRQAIGTVVNWEMSPRIVSIYVARQLIKLIREGVYTVDLDKLRSFNGRRRYDDDWIAADILASITGLGVDSSDLGTITQRLFPLTTEPLRLPPEDED